MSTTRLLDYARRMRHEAAGNPFMADTLASLIDELTLATIRTTSSRAQAALRDEIEALETAL